MHTTSKAAGCDPHPRDRTTRARTTRATRIARTVRATRTACVTRPAGLARTREDTYA